MAELLIRAKAHWMDSLTAEEVANLTAADKESYDARIRPGDVVVVKPDGWEWGREECLPNFFVVKLPGISVETVNKFVEPLMVADGVDELGNARTKILRRRKFTLPTTFVTTLKLANKNVTTVSGTVLSTFIQKMVERSA